MATKGKAAAKGGTKKRAAKKSDLDRRWSILFFALGALFIVLSLVPGSSLWLTLRENVLFGAFGISGWVLGPFLLYIALKVSFQKPIVGAVIRCVLFMLALSGTALIFGELDITGMDFGTIVAAVLETGRVSTIGGGLLSLFFGVPLLLFGRPAANILVVLVMVIAAMVFTGVTPAEVYRFFKGVFGKIPRREYGYDEDEDEYYEQEAPPPRKLPRAPRGKKQRMDIVDVDLGPTDPKSAPGLAENEPIDIPVGGTFGMNPLGDKEPPAAAALETEPILPFDPHSQQSLYDSTANMPGKLLFGDDDPYAGGAAPEHKNINGELFEEAEPAPHKPLFDQDAPEDLFGREAEPPQPVQEVPVPVQAGPKVTSPFEEPVSPMAGEVVDGAPADPGLQAMLEKAAAKKPGQDETAVDTRPVADVLEPYRYPPATLFSKGQGSNDAGALQEMQKTADLLVNTLASFGVQTRILDVSRGPSVTRYEVQPQTGVKISRITNLADDIALNLAAAGVRIEAPIPGKPAVGIEVPNRIKSTVSIRSILESSAFTKESSPLAIALGKDIAGENVVADLTKMPHLLVAGSTGSGKSVCINSIIMSILYKSSPEDVRLVLVDPKVVELAEYNGIPHLLMPVVTEPRKAAGALGAMVAEMEKRYHTFAEVKVRDINTYNKSSGVRTGRMEKMYHIAIIIDELADLMMTSGKEVEDYICRIAQKARAAGMHLIVATQRPSVDVITGLIKANIPSRIAFAVSSQVDSRTILDGAGAEKLLGMGDMLFMPVGANKPVRVQGTYVKDKEISAVLKYVKETSGGSRYDEDFIAQVESRVAAESGGGADAGGDDMMDDPTFQQAVDVALENGQISTSFLQRRLRLGYARAGRMMDEMERMGIISPPEGSKPRQVLISRQQWLEMSMNAGE